ncbi:MAG: hypothetical protein KKG04_09155 [Candidatus Thermoplasmatota archaeon]|nr:hypothetical protein [Candidatus Thermoplasmatota archaeon]
MKHVRKMIVGVVFSLICGGMMMTVEAVEQTISDPSGDVYYLPDDGGDVQMNIATQPDIDIVAVSYETTSDFVTISIMVLGDIQVSLQYLYYGEYTSADAKYQFTYKNGTVNAMVETDDSKLPVDTDVQIHGNTLGVTFALATADTSLVELYAYGHYYPEYLEDPVQMMMGSKYIDTTEDSDADVDPNGGSSDTQVPDGNTPGFEFSLLIMMILVVGLIWKKKK